MLDPTLNYDATCLHCGGPTVRGVNADFCSDVCESVHTLAPGCVTYRAGALVWRIALALDGYTLQVMEHDRDLTSDVWERFDRLALTTRSVHATVQGAMDTASRITRAYETSH